MMESKNLLYCSYTASPYLFGSDYPLEQIFSYSVPFESKGLLAINDFVLIVPAFKIVRNGQIFINPQKLFIDLKKLNVGKYQVVAVHNFQIEDCNPKLQECLIGIFLAGQVNGKWEEAENFPIECRTIEILAYIDTGTGQIL